MNINILNEFKIIFLKKLINIIINHTYVNYEYKITLTFIFLIILSFFDIFPSIFINFK